MTDSQAFSFPSKVNAVVIVRDDDQWVVMAGDEQVRFPFAFSDDDWEMLTQVQRALEVMEPSDLSNLDGFAGLTGVRFKAGIENSSVRDSSQDLRAGLTASSPGSAPWHGQTGTFTKTKPATNKGKGAHTTHPPGHVPKEHARIPFRDHMKQVGEARDHEKEGYWCSHPGCGKPADQTRRGVNACPWHSAWLDDEIRAIDKKEGVPRGTAFNIDLEMAAERQAQR